MKQLQLLIKPASSDCNLRCSYCFYEDECAHREYRSYGRMSEETLELTVKKALEAAEETCTFGFQGGEPSLAGLPFFEKYMEFVRRYKKPGTKVFSTIQSNGTLFDGAWAEFLRGNDFLVGISIDGTREFHDRNRKDRGGGETFSKVLRSAHALQKSGVDVNLLCVLTKQNARKIGSVYRFFKREGFYFQQYIPCLGPLYAPWGSKPWEMSGKEYGEALKALFDLWFEDFLSGERVSVREFDNWLLMLKGYPPEACASMGRCSMQNVIEADGSVYPCDFYVLDEYRVGNVHEEGFVFGRDVREERFFLEEEVRDSRCASCSWYPLCRGGCRRNCRRTEDGGMENQFCESYRMFFAYAIERLEWLADRI